MAEKKLIRVPLPDGRTATFPAGTRPEVIQATIQRIEAELKAAGGPNPPAGAPPDAAEPPGSAISAPGTGRPPGAPAPGELADSFLGRAVRAPIVNRVDPLAEMAVRGANAIGLAEDEALKGVQAQNAQRKAAYEASRQRAGDTGFDAAGTLGTGAMDVALLGRLGLPRSLLGMSGYGALGGGLTGMMTPVENSENLNGLQYTGQLLKQGLVGAGVGMLAAPAAAVSLDKLATGAKWVGREVGDLAKRFVAPTAAQRAASDQRQLEALLLAQAQSAGVDWAAVPNAVKESLREAARRATSTTGDFPADAVKNRLIAEAENLPQLTVGQSTRDPMAYSREANSPDPEIRALFGAQRNAATERLHEVANRFGPEKTPFELGSQVGDDVAAQAKARREAIRDAYDAFNNDAGGYHKITNTQDFVKSAISELKVARNFDDLPPAFQKDLLDLESSGGVLSIRDAADLWKSANAYYGTTKGTPTGSAIFTMKRNLEKLLDDAKFAGTKAGDETIKRFRAANQARHDMGEWERSSQAIATLAEKNPQVAAERVFDKYIMSGSVKDATGLWATLPAQTRLDVKRAFVDRVASTALNDYKSIATKAGSAAKLLDKFPKEKLRIMFDDAELKSLRNTIEYLRLTSEAPPGNFVNRSNSLVDLKDMLASTSNVPIMGPAFSRPTRALMEEQATRRATSGDLAVRPPLAAPELFRPIERRIPYMTGSFGAGVVGAEPSPEEE